MPLNIITGMTHDAFYANEARARSGEVDFGVMWRIGRSRWPNWRVSWIRDTGEVYATDNAYGRLYYVLGVCPNREIAEAVLDGWSDHIHEESSLEWVRTRLANITASRPF